jgi:predicted metalloprotease with PDZ domain
MSNPTQMMHSKSRLTLLAAAALTFFCLTASTGQTKYQYSLNLTDVKDDQLKVELAVPKITRPEITFFLPKIIPGTYSNADYGKFVHDVKAFDKAGKEMAVKKLTENSWQIKSATRLHKLTYIVEDTWLSELEHNIYDMAGTNIEAGKNYVLNTPGVFGYFDGMKEVPFELTITKPENLYGSTALTASKSDSKSDVFVLNDADHLYDSPIMYSVPDTTTIKLGRTEVLISVYSPRKMVTSKALADLLGEMLRATQNYLGGKLPVEKYAFIYYFNGEQAPLERTGALEHNYSSFYALPEYPFENLAPTLLDISAHEFFHVVTPLTISSREVKEFNFNEPVMSRHLWLYEGSTEYASDHVQVVEGIISPEQFLDKLTEKIKISQGNFNDTLPFTLLSKHSADKYEDQYSNVYEKGALIAATLDVYLLHLSKGNYGMKDLKQDLGIKYGKDKYFNDDELFDEITKLTFPEVRGFFKNYVEGSQAIPYDKFFGLAGVTMKVTESPSLGNVGLGGTPQGKLVVSATTELNALGKQLGYKTGDEFVSINGNPITIENAQEVIEQYKATSKKGDKIEVKVKRKNESGVMEDVTLTGNVVTIEVSRLEQVPNPTPEQLVVRNAWFGSKSGNVATAPPVEADPKDVGDIDSIVKALYDVLSGPAGERNWNRFRSLFYPGATMGAVVKSPQGKSYKKFSPEEYVKMNDPHFRQIGFYEKEIGRDVNTFGNIAQVFSAYEYTLETPQPIKQRGINSIGLIRENDRWLILSLTWDEESSDDPITSAHLFPKQEEVKKKKKK